MQQRIGHVEPMTIAEIDALLAQIPEDENEGEGVYATIAAELARLTAPKKKRPRSEPRIPAPEPGKPYILTPRQRANLAESLAWLEERPEEKPDRPMAEACALAKAETAAPSISYDDEQRAYLETRRKLPAAPPRRSDWSAPTSAPATDAEIEVLLAALDDTSSILAEPERLATVADEMRAAMQAIRHGSQPKSGNAVSEGASEGSEKGTSVTSQNTKTISSTVGTSNPSTRRPRRRKERSDVELMVRSTRRARRKGVQPPYEALREPGRIVIAHDELLRHGPVLGFTINIREDWAAKAIACNMPANFLSKRIRREFRLLGLTWVGWFFIEISRRLLHLHGACLGTPEQAKKIRLALRRAAGEWEVGEEKRYRQFQSHTSDDPDFGWVSYSTKEWGRVLTTKMIGPGHGFRFPFTGKPFAISEDVMRAAKARYIEERNQSLALAEVKNNSVLTYVEPSSIEEIDKSVSQDDSTVAPASHAPDTPESTTDVLLPNQAGGVRTPVPRASRSQAGRCALRGSRVPHRPAPALWAGDVRPRRHPLRSPGITAGRSQRAARPP